MANSMRFLAYCCVFLLTACHTHPRTGQYITISCTKAHQYQTRRCSFQEGVSSQPNLPTKWSPTSNNSHVHAENVMDIVRISKDNDDLSDSSKKWVLPKCLLYTAGPEEKIPAWQDIQILVAQLCMEIQFPHRHFLSHLLCTKAL